MKKTMSHAARMLALGFVAAVCPEALADECFCLHHAPSGAILRGCEAYRAPTEHYPTADCIDPLTGEKSTQTMSSEWQRIEAGADRCAPCKKVPLGNAKEVPRGGNAVDPQP